MKSKSFKALLILVGLTLFSTETILAATTNKFNYFFKSEASKFNIQGFYVVLGVIATGILFYLISNVLMKAEEPSNYSRPRHQHHRSVIKKTA